MNISKYIYYDIVLYKMLFYKSLAVTENIFYNYVRFLRIDPESIWDTKQQWEATLPQIVSRKSIYCIIKISIHS